MDTPKKKVVVVGGSGFLGSHTADALSDAGYAVTLFDTHLSPYIRADQQMVIGDIMDIGTLSTVFAGAEAVFHYAGVADLKDAMKDPVFTYTANIVGTANVLQACKLAQVKRLLFASSAYVYSDAGSYYRISKLASELTIEEFCKRNNAVSFTILRYGSVYGPRADMRNGVYRLIHQAMTKQQMRYHGTEHDVREYVHVHETARLSVIALDAKYRNQHLLLTGIQSYTAKQLLTLISEILGGIPYQILPPQSFVNYSVTPYTYSPKLAKKIVSTEFTDMGEGIVRIADDIHQHALAAQPSTRVAE